MNRPRSRYLDPCLCRPLALLLLLLPAGSDRAPVESATRKLAQLAVFIQLEQVGRVLRVRLTPVIHLSRPAYKAGLQRLGLRGWACEV